MKKMFITFSVLLLVYMLWPGPSSISQFPALPNSTKSVLEGDTIQVPNTAAYFSNNFRDFSTNYYRDAYKKLSFFLLPPLRLNHPPEFAFETIKKHTDSTFLEEFAYPLRDSLYVNGFEPFYPDGQPRFWGATKFEINGQQLSTKVTIRFYPSPIWVRVVVWTGIVVSIWLIGKLGKRILINE